MPVAGIICEYNPFHSGHAAHIAGTRELLGADASIVCVMSGNFVQRGEAAIVRKHARTAMALSCGADLVLELPVPWATASAERFATGGVSMLAAAGVVEFISFGSECGEIEPLGRAAKALLTNEAREAVAEKLKTGVSYAAARELALRELSGVDAEVLTRPNDILGVEYLKAVYRLNAKIEPVAVKRIATEHNGAESGGFAPASLIRERLLKGGDVRGYMPAEAFAVLEAETSAGRAPVTLSSAESAVLYRLRTMTDAEFEALPDSGEGLWRRFMDAARRETELEKVLMAAKTKRYAYSRLRRMALAAFLGVTAADVSGLPPYIRVLGFNGTGQKLLGRMRKTSALPIITKPASAKKLDGEARRIFALEARADDIYALMYPDSSLHRGGGEWLEGPVIEKN